jgi:hypothetical protein
VTLRQAVRAVEASDEINPPDIRRRAWLDGAHVGLGQTEFYWHAGRNTVPVPQVICIEDVVADDWELVPVVIDSE